MKPNNGGIELRSARSLEFRKSLTRYKVGFFSVLIAFVTSQMQLDLSDSLGKHIGFTLNAPRENLNQADKACK